MKNFVYIPVPEQHATQVHGLLVKLADGGSNDSNAAAGGGGESAFGGWAEEDLERLSKSPGKRAAGRGMLDLLSQSPGQPISYTAIVESLHLTEVSYKARCPALLGGYLRTGYQDGLPMDVTYRDAQTQGQASESYYIVSPPLRTGGLACGRAGSPRTDGELSKLCLHVLYAMCVMAKCGLAYCYHAPLRPSRGWHYARA